MRIIISAFNEFGSVNDSSTKYALSHATLPSHITKEYLSVDLNKTKEELCQIFSSNPELYIMLGQSGKDDKIHIERYARNILNFRIEDNGGNKPIDEEIIKGAPSILETKIDIESLNNYLNENKIPSELSEDAGSFICNYSYYLALNSGVNAIFIHFPLYISQSTNDKYHYLDKNTLIKAVELIVKFLEGKYDN